MTTSTPPQPFTTLIPKDIPTAIFDFELRMVMAVLPKELLTPVVSFLHWKDRKYIASLGHSKWNEAVAIATLKMGLDDVTDKDMNGALNFVDDYCPKLESLSVSLSLCAMTEFNRRFSSDKQRDVTLHGQLLAETIAARSGTLKSLYLVLPSHMYEYGIGSHVTRRFVEQAGGLQCISKCSSLRLFSISGVRFESPQQVVDTLGPLSPSLKVLRLSDIACGRITDSEDDQRVPRQLAVTISDMKSLQNLTLDAVCICPQQVIAILGHLSKSLKVFRLSSMDMDTDDDDDDDPPDFRRLLAVAISEMKNLKKLILHGQDLRDSDVRILLGPYSRELRALSLIWSYELTDTSLTSIAKNCPKLQELDVGGTDKITYEGIGKVLDACPLKALNPGRGTSLGSKWKDLVGRSSTLVLVYIDDWPILTKEAIDEITQAIIACGGRTLFVVNLVDTGKYIYIVDKAVVGPDVFKKSVETYDMLKKMGKRDFLDVYSSELEFIEWED